MAFRMRAYQPQSSDLEAMVALSQASWAPQRRPDTYFHVGDLYWKLREPDYEQALWLWEKEEYRIIAGFSELSDLSDDAQTLEFQIHPDYVGSGIERDMLDWAEARAAAQGVDASLTTFASEADTALAALLLRSGYQQQESYFNHHLRRLDTELESPILPDGFIVRHLRGPEEWAARVAGHRAGWESTRMTEEIYARMTRLGGYRPDLDIVVEAPGLPLRFVATCNCWMDEASGVGLFEPVSTDPDYRRQGLARALLLYGMAQLRALGATAAAVCSTSGNPAATRLYESCGMPVVRRDFPYCKLLRESARAGG